MEVGPPTPRFFLYRAYVRLAIFHRLFPLASDAGLRVVLVNRRDYPGSTPFSDEDILLTAPESPPEDSDIFLWARALELSRFLAWFIHESDIPPIKTSGSGQREGGLSVVAWSSSNTILMSLMSNLARLPDDLREGLEPYMRSYIHFGELMSPLQKPHSDYAEHSTPDGPRWALGYPDSEYFTGAHPLMDASLSEAEKFSRFKVRLDTVLRGCRSQHPRHSSVLGICLL